MNALTILICTHNRVDLLKKVIESLNRTQRPLGWNVSLLVVANSCQDATHQSLQDYGKQDHVDTLLPLRWLEEPTAGKSHALNCGASAIDTGWVAIVDDDHRVADDFLVEIARAAAAHPEATMLCGRILPDWDGREPKWVHDDGPYRIYPLPIPRQEFGDTSRVLGFDGPIPGGGNQIIQVSTIRRVGSFSTELGPQGHDLGGGEDTEYMLRALRQGERLVYVPQIVQYHFVDQFRLKLGYVMRKAYQRSYSGVLFSNQASRGVPLYAWRKLAEYFLSTFLSLSWSRTRFFLVRCAASLGEISAMRPRGEGKNLREQLKKQNPSWPPAITIAGAGVATGAVMLSGFSKQIASYIAMPAVVAIFCGLILLASSLVSFSRTGPELRKEILKNYTTYSFLAILRLTFWVVVLFVLMAGIGGINYTTIAIGLGLGVDLYVLLFSSLLGIVGILTLQFCNHLLYMPASICVSLNVLPSRFYWVWGLLTPARVKWTFIVLLSVSAGFLVLASFRLVARGYVTELIALWGVVVFYMGIYAWATWRKEPQPIGCSYRSPGQPNIIMIGSDTLRADRLGALGYHRKLTPNLDALASKGSIFSQCFVPCARTAPSLLSLLTAMWPHHHGVRDNFIADENTSLCIPDMPDLLRQHGYITAAISDWCGGDLKKFPFGFDYVDSPNDQWNVKYLIRQGPKNLRLILGLFSHNRFGKAFLPELYYLAGVPMTDEVGRQGRRVLSELAKTKKPFFLNLFYSTTHPPFGVEYPYYAKLAKHNYQGESKFVMARLTEPFEIIRRQGQPKEEFDLEQILDLYDGCVARFDDEVGNILNYLKINGLADNTIVVVYSDHGMEFFEHNTWGQGNSAVGDFSPRVPLVIYNPEGRNAGKVDQIVRSIDLMPTLLELANITRPVNLDGISFLPLINGVAEAPRSAFYETGIWIADIPGMPKQHLRYPNLLELLEVPDTSSGTLAIKSKYKEIIISAKDRMIRFDHWKLVYQPLENGYILQLFDVQADPDCAHDLSGNEQEITLKLWVKLVEWITQDSVFEAALDKIGTKGYLQMNLEA